MSNIWFYIYIQSIPVSKINELLDIIFLLQMTEITIDIIPKALFWNKIGIPMSYITTS